MKFMLIDSWRRTVILIPGNDAEHTCRARAFLKLRRVNFVEARTPQADVPRLLVSGTPFDGLDEIHHGVSIYGL